MKSDDRRFHKDRIVPFSGAQIPSRLYNRPDKTSMTPFANDSIAELSVDFPRGLVPRCFVALPHNLVGARSAEAIDLPSVRLVEKRSSGHLRVERVEVEIGGRWEEESEWAASLPVRPLLPLRMREAARDGRRINRPPRAPALSLDHSPVPVRSAGEAAL